MTHPHREARSVKKVLRLPATCRITVSLFSSDLPGQRWHFANIEPTNQSDATPGVAYENGTPQVNARMQRRTELGVEPWDRISLEVR
jgi:hypothetical protein